MRKFFYILLITLTIIYFPFVIYADDFIENTDLLPVSSDISSSNSIPEIYSKSAIIFERNSKQILFEKNIYEKVPMASTTKIMTCILIIENCQLDSNVCVSSNAASTIGSRLGLSTNDQITVKDLLYGLMLCSGNDSAVCLAEFCSGSVDEFITLMNNKAVELGLNSTHFVTPHGLDDDNHYTTAFDFAILTDYALNNPLFKQIVETKYYTVNINGTVKQIHNTNELLGSFSGVYGVKTGYTSNAGRCLISAASIDNLDVIVIVFGADTKNIRTSDSIKLLNYAFSNFEMIDLKSLIEKKYSEYISYYLPYIKINKSSDSLCTYLEDYDINYYPVEKSDNIVSSSINIYELDSPIKKDQIVATIDLYVNNSKIYSANIRSLSYIKRKEPLDYLLQFVSKYKTYYTI